MKFNLDIIIKFNTGLFNFLVKEASGYLALGLSAGV